MFFMTVIGSIKKRYNYIYLDYYFKIAENPTWNYFAYNAEKILNGKLEVEQDIKEREERRKLARRWISE